MFSSAAGRGCLGGQHPDPSPPLDEPGRMEDRHRCCEFTTFYFSLREKKVEGKKVHNHDHNFKNLYYLGWAVLS